MNDQESNNEELVSSDIAHKGMRLRDDSNKIKKPLIKTNKVGNIINSIA